MVSYEELAREALLNSGLTLAAYGELDIDTVQEDLFNRYGNSKYYHSKHYVDGRVFCDKEEFEGRYSVTDIAEEVLELSQQVYSEIDEDSVMFIVKFFDYGIEDENGITPAILTERFDDFYEAEDEVMSVYRNMIESNKHNMVADDWNQFVNNVRGSIFYVDANGDDVEYWRPLKENLEEIGWTSVTE